MQSRMGGSAPRPKPNAQALAGPKHNAQSAINQWIMAVGTMAPTTKFGI